MDMKSVFLLVSFALLALALGGGYLLSQLRRYDEE